MIVHNDLSTYEVDLTTELLKGFRGKDRSDPSSILFPSVYTSSVLRQFTVVKM